MGGTEIQCEVAPDGCRRRQGNLAINNAIGSQAWNGQVVAIATQVG